MSDICWAVKMCADQDRWLVIGKDGVCRWSKHWASRSLASTREEAATALRDLRKDGMPYLKLVKVTRSAQSEVRARDQKHRYFGLYRGFRDAAIEVGLVTVPESTVDYYLHVMARLDQKTREAAAKAGVTYSGRPLPLAGDPTKEEAKDVG